MKISAFAKLGTCIICAMFLGNAIASQSSAFTLADNTKQATVKKDSTKHTAKTAKDSTKTTAKATKESSKPAAKTAEKTKEATKPAALTDNQLAAKVRDVFVSHKLYGKDKFADMGIHVTSNKGVVTLTGRVANKADEDMAIKLAKEQSEVKSVVSKITVKK